VGKQGIGSEKEDETEQQYEHGDEKQDDDEQ
jgi:hypothetical protein